MAEIIEPISQAEANALLHGAHYLGRIRNADYVLSTPDRSAIAIYRPPVAQSFTKALSRPLELTRLWRTPGRTAPLSSFLAVMSGWRTRRRPLSEMLGVPTIKHENGMPVVRGDGGDFYSA